MRLHEKGCTQNQQTRAEQLEREEREREANQAAKEARQAARAEATVEREAKQAAKEARQAARGPVEAKGARAPAEASVATLTEVLANCKIEEAMMNVDCSDEDAFAAAGARFDDQVHEATHAVLDEIISQMQLFKDSNIEPQHVLIWTEAMAEIAAGLPASPAAISKPGSKVAWIHSTT